MLTHGRLALHCLLLIALCYAGVQAQSPTDARAELLRQKRAFDLSDDAGRRESIASFVAAAIDGERKIVELYLAAGMDINAQDQYMQTALYGAAAERKYSTAMMLLGRGANPNLANDKGIAPLAAAILRGDFDTTRNVREPARETWTA